MSKYQISDSEDDIKPKKFNKNTFFEKFKKDILQIIKDEINKNQESIFEILDPFLLKFVEKIQFEFHLYILLGSVALLFIIILFIINIIFIIKFRP